MFVLFGAFFCAEPCHMCKVVGQHLGANKAHVKVHMLLHRVAGATLNLCNLIHVFDPIHDQVYA